MTLANDKHQEKLLAAGWHSRGYLPHFDGIAIPQFVTIDYVRNQATGLIAVPGLRKATVRISLFRKKRWLPYEGAAVVLCALRA
jgi:hypothetical protein